MSTAVITPVNASPVTLERTVQSVSYHFSVMKQLYSVYPSSCQVTTKHTYICEAAVYHFIDNVQELP